MSNFLYKNIIILSILLETAIQNLEFMLGRQLIEMANVELSAFNEKNNKFFHRFFRTPDSRILLYMQFGPDDVYPKSVCIKKYFSFVVRLTSFTTRHIHYLLHCELFRVVGLCFCFLWKKSNNKIWESRNFRENHRN